MDVVPDQLAEARPCRVRTVVEQRSRRSPLLRAAFSIHGEDVADAVDRVAATTPLPRSITVDHGTAFVPRALDDWADRRGVPLDCTRPGKPTDNGHIESCNGRLRDEGLNGQQFVSLADAREKIEAWRCDDTHVRPHSALGHLPPSECIIHAQENRTPKAAPLLQ